MYMTVDRHKHRARSFFIAFPIYFLHLLPIGGKSLPITVEAMMRCNYTMQSLIRRVEYHVAEPYELIGVVLNLVEVENLFVANSTLKSVPKLKKAKKIAFYNCEIKTIKKSVCPDVEIANQITDEQLSEKFDSFTDWYNSDVLQKSMDLLGDVVNQIKG